ncbi:MAG: acyl-CoA/acyl-ACP dehydrogenase [Proteobacteria bacterium]|nr:acyl-CoA/acyl-ACP dehydrogenase [Pseudomonadota bacterium]
MDFDLSDEQRMIVDTADKIARTFGADYWLEKENRHEFPQDFMDELGRAGFLGFCIPEEYGGNGLGMTEASLAFEALGAKGGGAAPGLLYLLASVFGGLSVFNHGNEAQKRAYLPRIASGRLLVSLGLTEPDAGSNTMNTRTFARKDGDDYVINGNKIFISGVENAGAIVLVTRTTKKEDAEKKSLGLSLFLVDLPQAAIRHTEIPKHAGDYIGTYELGIDDLRVPHSALLGQEGLGWYHVLDTLNPERIIAAVAALGVGKAAVYQAVRYANQREVFGRAIGSHQGIQFPLAAAYNKLECAWLATLKAATLYDKKAPQKKVGDVSNIAKFAATEAAVEAVYHAMQTLGGYGFAKEYHIERWWREVQLMRLAPITQQMTLNYTAEHILGLPRSY